MSGKQSWKTRLGKVKTIATCPDCGKNTPLDADYCPECGSFLGAGKTTIISPQTETSPPSSLPEKGQKVPFYKSKWGIGLIVAVSVLLLFCCLSGALGGILYFRNSGTSEDYQAQATEIYDELKDDAVELDSAIKDASNKQDLVSLSNKIDKEQRKVRQMLKTLENLKVSDKDQDSYGKLKEALQAYLDYLRKLKQYCQSPLNLDLSAKAGEISSLVQDTIEAFDEFTDASPFIDKSADELVEKSKEIISMLERARKNLALSKVKTTPNPFSPNNDGKDDSTTIYFDIPKSSAVTVKILDSGGTELITLADKEKPSVIKHQISWNGDDNLGNVLVNGVYNYKIVAEFDSASKTKEGTLTIEGVALSCSDCAGTGQVSCSDCGGDGSYTCSQCGGAGSYDCSECGSWSKAGDCETCDGKGWYYTELGQFTCDVCNGTGDCPRCDGAGKTDCQKCGGDGALSCSTCGGDGKFICSTCGGDGTI